MKKTHAIFLHSPEMERYHYPPECPFKTERAAMTRSLLLGMGMYEGEGRAEVAPVAATEEQLRWFHSQCYLAALQRVAGGVILPDDLMMGIGTPETPVFRDLFAYAALAAGASLTGARWLLEGKADIAFNPSGGFHHAFSEKAGGFCYINDVVLACLLLKRAGKRVFCLDLDAHHGNGTQDAFYRDPSVFTVSFHESGETLFPWGGSVEEIGEGAGAGYNANIPLPAATDDEAFAAAFVEIVPPLIDAYKPDVLVVEIGMDVLAGDPLTHLRMTNNVFPDTVIPHLLAPGKPLLVVGGGGYDPERTARGWALVWLALCGLDAHLDEPLGMGGVFLGSTEWNAGMRDMRVYSSGDVRDNNAAQVNKTVSLIKSSLFPRLGIYIGHDSHLFPHAGDGFPDPTNSG